ncbi:MAG: DUF4956 domain-containing protein [Candidatus Cloacimonetes bacterium]|nr:DUF4956 domain-containing protein [Candidatus Cloacimonadota bacterium]
MGFTGKDLSYIVYALLLSFFVSIIISQIYKRTHRGMNFELAFMSTLVLLSPIVTIVMLYIRGDLVLSLGLIGSLSIIRFRTPIKDTRDMVFLFWAIAVGLGCGTYNWTVVIISTIFITIVMFLLYFTNYGRSINRDFILVVRGTMPYNDEDIHSILSTSRSEAKIRSQEIGEGRWEIVYELRLPKNREELALKMIKELESKDGVSQVSLLAPQIALPV